MDSFTLLVLPAIVGNCVIEATTRHQAEVRWLFSRLNEKNLLAHSITEGGKTEQTNKHAVATKRVHSFRSATWSDFCE
jgi:hypothetical protein